MLPICVEKISSGFHFRAFYSLPDCYCYRQGQQRVDFHFTPLCDTRWSYFTVKLIISMQKCDSNYLKFSHPSHPFQSGIQPNFTNYFLILSWKFGFICWVRNFITIVYHSESEFEFITTDSLVHVGSAEKIKHVLIFTFGACCRSMERGISE